MNSLHFLLFVYIGDTGPVTSKWHSITTSYVPHRNRPICFTVDWNRNVIKAASGSDLFHLGNFTRWEDCNNKCANTRRCGGWTFYTDNYTPARWRRQCYGTREEIEIERGKRECCVISGGQNKGCSRREPSTYIQAWEQCYDYRAKLASVHSSEEREFMLRLYAEKKRNITTYMWIGLRDDRKGRVRWIDGSDYDFIMEHEDGSPMNGTGRTGMNMVSGYIRQSKGEEELFGGYVCRRKKWVDERVG